MMILRWILLETQTLSSESAFDLRETNRLHCIVVSDADAVRSALAFANDQQHYSCLVEPACGAALACVANPELLDPVCPRGQASNVVVVVCGGSVITEELMATYARNLGVVN